MNLLAKTTAVGAGGRWSWDGAWRLMKLISLSFLQATTMLLPADLKQTRIVGDEIQCCYLQEAI